MASVLANAVVNIDTNMSGFNSGMKIIHSGLMGMQGQIGMMGMGAATVFRGMQRGFETMTRGVTIFRIGMQTAFEQGLAPFHRNMRILFSVLSLGTSMMMSFGTVAVAAFLGLKMAIAATIPFGARLIESLRQVDMAFGDVSRRIRQTGDDLARLGVVRSAALAGMAGTGLALMGAGFTRDQSAQMAESLARVGVAFRDAGLAGDAQAGMNMLQNAIRGNVGALEDLGFYLDEDAVKMKAQREGIALAGRTMTEQQKITARFMLIMEQSQHIMEAASRSPLRFGVELDKMRGKFVNALEVIGSPVATVAAERLRDMNDWWEKNGISAEWLGEKAASAFQSMLNWGDQLFGILGKIWDWLQMIAGSTVWNTLGDILAKAGTLGMGGGLGMLGMGLGAVGGASPFAAAGGAGGAAGGGGLLDALADPASEMTIAGATMQASADKSAKVMEDAEIERRRLEREQAARLHDPMPRRIFEGAGGFAQYAREIQEAAFGRQKPLNGILTNTAETNKFLANIARAISTKSFGGPRMGGAQMVGNNGPLPVWPVGI
jgi:hypothetical protein